MLLLRCRLAEIAQSLELYGLDPSVKLNPRCAEEEVVNIVAKSLLRDRDKRYANAGAMKKDLEQIDR